jgi:large subunit ribosomal protein L10
MKTREQKQKDLEALAQQFQAASTAMFVGFKKMTVPKDQELRNRLREAGAEYTVVKNTLARRAAEGTPFAQAAEHFKGVTAVALGQGDAVTLSKAVSKFAKDNPEVFTFKAGVVEGKVVALRDVEAIASLPPKEELISKIMFLINCQATRLVTVLSAVPRNLAIVIKQIGEQKGGGEEAAPQ